MDNNVYRLVFVAVKCRVKISHHREGWDAVLYRIVFGQTLANDCVKQPQLLDCLFWKVMEMVRHRPSNFNFGKVLEEGVYDMVWLSDKHFDWNILAPFI